MNFRSLPSLLIALVACLDAVIQESKGTSSSNLCLRDVIYCVSLRITLDQMHTFAAVFLVYILHSLCSLF